MKTRTIILYWVLVLFPTLFICVGALRLLRHEQERLATRESRAIAQRVEATAGDVQLAVGELRDAVLSELGQGPGDADRAALQAWQARNPLLRHTFIWHRDRGCFIPMPPWD